MIPLWVSQSIVVYWSYHSVNPASIVSIQLNITDWYIWMLTNVAPYWYDFSSWPFPVIVMVTLWYYPCKFPATRTHCGVDVSRNIDLFLYDSSTHQNVLIVANPKCDIGAGGILVNLLTSLSLFSSRVFMTRFCLSYTAGQWEPNEIYRKEHFWKLLL